jgi:hypothetical protein
VLLLVAVAKAKAKIDMRGVDRGVAKDPDRHAVWLLQDRHGVWLTSRK